MDAEVFSIAIIGQKSIETMTVLFIRYTPLHGPGGRKVRVHGYFAIPVLGPQDYAREIEETKKRIAEIEAEIAQLESDIEENPPTSNPKQTAVQSEDEPVWTEEDGDDGTMTAMEYALCKAMRKAQKEGISNQISKAVVRHRKSL